MLRGLAELGVAITREPSRRTLEPPATYGTAPGGHHGNN